MSWKEGSGYMICMHMSCIAVYTIGSLAIGGKLGERLILSLECQSLSLMSYFVEPAANHTFWWKLRRDWEEGKSTNQVDSARQDQAGDHSQYSHKKTTFPWIHLLSGGADVIFLEWQTVQKSKTVFTVLRKFTNLITQIMLTLSYSKIKIVSSLVTPQHVLCQRAKRYKRALNIWSTPWSCVAVCSK